MITGTEWYLLSALAMMAFVYLIWEGVFVRDTSTSNPLESIPLWAYPFIGAMWPLVLVVGGVSVVVATIYVLTHDE